MLLNSGRIKPPHLASLSHEIKKEMAKNRQLYLIVLLPVVYIIVFGYVPLYGAQIAFRDYRAADGFWGSQWVGLKYFIMFIKSYQFTRVLRNTLVISVYSMIAGFPIPILLALALNNTRSGPLKKIVQMATYAPHFISTVVMGGIIIQFLSLQYGIVNRLIEALGGEAVMFMGIPAFFSSIYVWSDVWQGMGWNSIIYLSALSAIDPQLHEAAIVDGASQLKRILHIDLPGILPTVVILFILNTGQLLNLGVEKILLLQNSMNLEASESISTYLYKIAFASGMPNYSYSAAIGLFNAVVNFVMILTVNKIAGRFGGISLW